MAVTWDRTQTSFLIELWEANRSLYDPSHNDYKDKIVRRKTILHITSLISEMRPNTTPKHIIQKIRTLRTQYGVEKNRREAGKSQGSTEPFKPRLWCYNELHFLDKYVLTKSPMSNIEKIEDDDTSSTASSEVLKIPSIKMEPPDEIEPDEELNYMRIEKEFQRIPKESNFQKEYQRNTSKTMQIDAIDTIAYEPKKSSNEKFMQFIEEEINSIHDEKILSDLKWKMQVLIREAKIKEQSNA